MHWQLPLCAGMETFLDEKHVICSFMLLTSQDTRMLCSLNCFSDWTAKPCCQLFVYMTQNLRNVLVTVKIPNKHSHWNNQYTVQLIDHRKNLLYCNGNVSVKLYSFNRIQKWMKKIEWNLLIGNDNTLCMFALSTNTFFIVCILLCTTI